MGIVKDMFRSYAAVNTKKDSLRFAFRLIGFDRKTAEEILSEDEEVWRTSEEGKHFKFETSTGEIKAGFGGKFNGKKLGQTWGAGHAKAPKAPTAPGKSSGNESEKRSGKGYWLHNVPESRMLEAANMMSGLKRDLRNAEIRAKSAYRLFQTGMITAGEYEDRLKPFGLENYTPNMSPEEFTMKCGKPEKKAELLGFMGEAKEWDKNADKLAKENWDEQDSKLAAALADKYGTMAQFPEAKIPDDSSLTDKWDKDDLACWYDLKSKALGGPVSEKEPPESLQIAAGLKEGTVEHPARPKADYDWYQPSSYGNMEAFMAGVAGEQVSYGHQYTKEEFADLNQKFLDKVKYDKVSPNLVTYYGIGAVGTMRQRMGLFGASKPTPEMLSRLSDKEKQDMLNTVNTFMNLRAFSPETRDSIEDVTFEDMERAERIIARLNMNSFRSQAKLQPFKDYILAQEKMLIGAEPSSVDKVGEEKKNKEDAAKAAEKAKKEQIRKEQQEFRQSDAAKEKAAKIEKM